MVVKVIVEVRVQVTLRVTAEVSTGHSTGRISGDSSVVNTTIGDLTIQKWPYRGRYSIYDHTYIRPYESDHTAVVFSGAGHTKGIVIQG